MDKEFGMVGMRKGTVETTLSLSHKRATVAEAGLLTSLRMPRMCQTHEAKLKPIKKPTDEVYPYHPVQPLEPLADFEVQSLPHNPGATAAGNPVAGVRLMIEDRKARHSTCLNHLKELKEELSDTLVSAVEKEIRIVKDALSEADRDILSRLDVLHDDIITDLEEDGVRGVLESILNQRPMREKFLIEASTALSVCENRCRESAEKKLYNIITSMTATSHLSGSSIERLIEDETHKINVCFLEWRRSIGDMMMRLKRNGIQLEKERRIFWNSKMTVWRRLRTEYAMETFRARIASEEYMKPAERSRIFIAIQGGQDKIYDTIQSHVLASTSLLPPFCITDKVDAWDSLSTGILGNWDGQRSMFGEQLSAHENDMQTNVENLLSSTAEEIKRYASIEEDQVFDIIQRECGENIKNREENAGMILSSVISYLDFQRSNWADVLKSLKDFFCSLSEARELHLAKVEEIDSKTRQSLNESRSEHEDTNAEREQKLEETISSIRQSASETGLDVTVECALNKLDEIEDAYRKFHSITVNVVRSHKQSMSNEMENYRQKLCNLLAVEPILSRGGTGESDKFSLKDAIDKDDSIVSSLGSPYKLSHTLYTRVFKDLRDKDSTKQEEELCPVDNTTPPANDSQTGGNTMEASKSGDLESSAETDVKLSDADASPDASQSKAMDRGAEFYSRPPEDEAGVHYCKALDLSKDFLSSLLSKFQKGLLDDMEAEAKRTMIMAKDFCVEQEEYLTNELDTRLRQHRPRAGRIEEEVRQERSVQLVEQQRRFERYVRSAQRGIRDQNRKFKDKLDNMKVAMNDIVTKLQQLEGHLGTSASVNVLEIRKREAYSLRDQAIEKAKNQSEVLVVDIESDQKKTLDAHDTFLRENLKGFDQGGLFADESIKEYEKKLSVQKNLAIKQTQKQVEDVNVVRSSFIEEIKDVVVRFEGELPPHKVDLTFIEAYEASIVTARAKVKAEISNSEKCEKSLQEKIEALEDAVSAKQGDMQQCQTVLAAVDELRRLVLPRTQFLKCLSSTISHAEIDVKLLEEEFEASASVATPQTAECNGTLAIKVEGVLEECKSSLNTISKEYYSARDGTTPITRPEKIPEKMEDIVTSHEAVLESMRQTVKQHEEQAIKVLKAQVIRLSFVLTKVPTIVISTIGDSVEENFKSGARELNRKFEKKQIELQPERAKSAWSKVGHTRDESRNEEIRNNDLQYAREGILLLHRSCSTLHTNLEKVLTIITSIIDNFVLPEDLQPSTAENDHLTTMKRKNLKKMLRQKAWGAQGELLSEYPTHGKRPFQARKWASKLEKSLDVRNLGDKPVLDAESEASLREVYDATAGTTHDIRGLDTPCVHCAVEARDDVLERFKSIVITHLENFSERFRKYSSK